METQKRLNKGRTLVWVITIIAVMVMAAGAYVGITIKKADAAMIKSHEEFRKIVEEAIVNFDDSIVVQVKDFNEVKYSPNVVNEIIESRPELRGNIIKYNGNYKSIFRGTEVNIQLEYYIDSEEVKRREQMVNDKVNEIVGTLITDGMKDYEKEKALHDYLINNCKYDSSTTVVADLPREVFTAYGALINKSAVCQGYALAFDKLLKAANIETQIVVGDAKNQEGSGYISHAWNLIKLDGEYYHVDTTWNDPVIADGSDILRYSYFNVTDEQLLKNHKWERNNYPDANGTKYSFENLNYVEKDTNGNDFVILNSVDELATAIKNDVRDRRTSASYKVKNFSQDNEYVLSLMKDGYIYYNRGGEFQVLSKIDEITNAGYLTLQYTYY